MRRLLASQKSFQAIVALFVGQAGWIAGSSHYPMAFDEDFHLGVIRLYAHHWSPFWGSDPGAAVYGAVSRDPSYLYHWLMAWPYRLISLFTDNQVAQVIFLRFINIALFAVGLIIIRRLLRRIGASEAITNLSLLLFVLVPVVPFLAAQINYDNLFIPALGLCLLLTMDFVAGLKKSGFGLSRFLLLVSGCLLTSLIKYAFLPVLLIIALYVAWKTLAVYPRLKGLGHALTLDWRGLKPKLAVGLALLTLLSAGLFAERYGLNFIRYHTPLPDCAQVLDVKRCRAYGPWVRDYDLAAARESLPSTSISRLDGPLSYTQHEWLYGMWFRLFFSLDGPTGQFQTRGPLLLPGVGAIVLAGVGAVSLVAVGRRFWRRYDLRTISLLTAVSLTYLVALWLTEYQAYIHTGKPVAINGRYLLPILPFSIVVGALATNQLTQRLPRLQAGLAVIAVLCIAWGGGALTFILRSSDSWLWDNASVRHINYSIRNTLGPVVPGYSKDSLFLR